MAKISKKDVYNRLWEGRNFEIEHLWQRSIFLGAFLILFFTVYFTVLGSVFSAANDASIDQSVISAEATMRGTLFTVAEKEAPESFDILKYLSDNKGANVALLVISVLGASFSLLWIFMAKGSKYWYEKYERSIDEMQDYDELFDDAINREWRVEEARAKLEYRELHYIPLQGYMPHKDRNDSVFSNEGGAYSLSKVNVAIGHIFCLFWILVFVFHIYLLFDYKFSMLSTVWTLMIALVLFAFLTVLIGNSNISGEADWTNPSRVLKRWRLNKDKYFKKNRKRRNENKWFIKLLKDNLSQDIPEVIRNADPLLLKSNLTSKIKTAVKHPRNSDDKGWLLTYLEEKIFTKVYPHKLKGEWTNPKRKPISFVSENSDDMDIEEDFLSELYKNLSQISANLSLKVRKFADIPWNELNKKEHDKKKKKRKKKKELSALSGADSWTLHYILCDKDDNYLCCEIFRCSIVNGKPKLTSSLILQNGELIMEYIWKKVKATNSHAGGTQ